MGQHPSWRLSGRIVRWCFACGTGFVAVLAVTGYVLVHLETKDELDGIIREELVEMGDVFTASWGTPETFADCVKELQEAHPDNSMSWRVWNRRDGSVWGTFGAQELRDRLPTMADGTPA